MNSALHQEDNRFTRSPTLHWHNEGYIDFKVSVYWHSQSQAQS